MKRFEHMDEQAAREYFDAYLASLPLLRKRLTRRLSATGGPEIDATLDGLPALDKWFEREILSPTPDGLTGVPLWWDPNRFAHVPQDMQLRIVDEVGAHLAEVFEIAVPETEWVVRKERGGARTRGHHRTSLRLAKGYYVEPWILPYSHVASILRGDELRANMLTDDVATTLQIASARRG